MTEAPRLSVQGADDAAVRALVSDMYRLFHRREPDTGGLDHYAEQLKDGLPLAES